MTASFGRKQARGIKSRRRLQMARRQLRSDCLSQKSIPAIRRLLTPVEEPEALLLAQDASWWFQQKFDGRRLAVQKSEGKYSGINKLGQIILLTLGWPNR